MPRPSRRRAAAVSAMPDEAIDTLVIGGGQAGLTMSHRLKQRGISHLVLERHRIAERWRSERWDGLKFQFPNWAVRLPEFSFPHADPDAFADTDEIINFIEAYAAFVDPPIRCGVEVTRLSRGDGGDGFIAETSDGAIAASHVVVATGPYQRAADAKPVARRKRLSGARQRLQKSKAASAGRGAGDRLRRVRRADRRRVAPRRQARVSLRRP